MRTKVFAAVLLIVVTVVGLSATRDTPVREALLPAPSAAEAALDRVLPDLQFEALPFDEAVRRLEVAAGAQVRIDREEMSSTGVDCTTPVRLRVRGVRLSEALSRLIAQLKLDETSASPGFAPDVDAVGFVPDGGAVLVSTERALAGHVLMRCYDVRDLLPPQAPPEPDLPKPNLPAGGGLFGNQHPAVLEGPAHAIAIFIEDAVAPDTWRINGGSFGLMRFLSGRLVVVQTWDNHRKIESLLAALRRPIPASGGAGVDELAWDPRLKKWAPAVPDAAERALRTVLPEVKLQDASLDEAVRTLGRLARANIVLDGKSMMEAELDRKHLENAGVDLTRSRRLTLTLYDVTLERALEAVLLSFSDNVWSGGFMLQDGGIIVTRASVASGVMFTRVYDLCDWPHPGAAAARHRRPASDDNFKTRAEDVEELVEAITTAVGAESWRENGGTGSMVVVADRLVVTQNWRNHEQVRWFLNALRGGGGAPPATAPAARRRE